jgi:glucose-6-phosphate dehydrogenase assembly protein OpcA
MASDLGAPADPGPSASAATPEDAQRDLTFGSGIWSARDTTPSEIEAALRDLLQARHAQSETYVPARVLNMVVIADREWRGEISNRLESVGRYHPSRTILCAYEPGRKTLDAWATMSAPADPTPGSLALCHEQVIVDVGPEHLKHLDTIIDPLVVSDLATAVWSPHGHPDAVDSLMHLAQVVLIDSIYEPDPGAAVARARTLAERAYVVDLAWLRSTPWRERITATFDPPAWRRELDLISGVSVRHRPDSRVAGVLFFGWLASRLGWEPGAMISRNGSLYGRARAPRQEVALRLDPDERQNAPGLAGITVETASGMSISLDRGEGGLSARRRLRDGRELSWTVMGASRGEAGILGEGIRQALLRDPTYRPALTAAVAMFR